MHLVHLICLNASRSDWYSGVGNSYFLIFTDNKSRFVHTMFMKHKNDAFIRFNKYVNFLENVTGKYVKNLQSNKGGESMIPRSPLFFWVFLLFFCCFFCKPRDIYISRSISLTPEKTVLQSGWIAQFMNLPVLGWKALFCPIHCGMKLLLHQAVSIILLKHLIQGILLHLNIDWTLYSVILSYSVYLLYN